jgi:hypothetical protein
MDGCLRPLRDALHLARRDMPGPGLRRRAPLGRPQADQVPLLLPTERAQGRRSRSDTGERPRRLLRVLRRLGQGPGQQGREGLHRFRHDARRPGRRPPPRRLRRLQGLQQVHEMHRLRLGRHAGHIPAVRPTTPRPQDPTRDRNSSQRGAGATSAFSGTRCVCETDTGREPGLTHEGRSIDQFFFISSMASASAFPKRTNVLPLPR